VYVRILYNTTNQRRSSNAQRSRLGITAPHIPYLRVHLTYTPPGLARLDWTRFCSACDTTHPIVNLACRSVHSPRPRCSYILYLPAISTVFRTAPAGPSYVASPRLTRSSSDNTQPLCKLRQSTRTDDHTRLILKTLRTARRPVTLRLRNARPRRQCTRDFAKESQAVEHNWIWPSTLGSSGTWHSALGDTWSRHIVTLDCTRLYPDHILCHSSPTLLD
jgi:hypothetical protein